LVHGFYFVVFPNRDLLQLPHVLILARCDRGGSHIRHGCPFLGKVYQVIGVNLGTLQAPTVIYVYGLPLGKDFQRSLTRLAVAVASAAGAAERELDLCPDGTGVDVNDTSRDVSDRLERRVDVRVKIELDRPYGRPVVDAIASARSFASITLSTGPKISSCATRISGRTPSKMVGV
jgi:hypothetical protein